MIARTARRGNRIASRLLALALAAAAAGCVQRAPATGGAPAAERGPAVVLISIDGLRPDAIDAAGARTLQRLRAEGASAASAMTVLPSKTLPSHTSMLTGMDVPGHGITWNDDRTAEHGVVGVPTVFEVAHGQGLRTAASFGKSKFRHLVRPGSLDWVTVRRGSEVRVTPEIVEEATAVIRSRRPDLVFVHLADPDLAGHAFGWMSIGYRAAVRRADAGVERVLRAAEEAYGDRFVLIVTADHGGEGRRHGSETDPDRQIPWLAWGAGVRPGVVEEPVRTYDTAATALWILGVPIPAHFDGRPVTGAFTARVSGR